MTKPITFITIFTAALLTACQPAQTENTTASAPQAETAASAVSEPLTLNGTDIRKDDIGGDFTLTDGDGKPFTLSSLKGKLVILSFGYTHCPDVCPTGLLTYNDALKQLGDKAKEVAVIFVSVDPERDTPKLIGEYAKMFNPEFIGLTATGDQNLPLVKQQFRVISAKAGDSKDGNYLVDHTAGAYLIDKNGNAAVFEPYGKKADEIAHDIEQLLK